MQHRWLFTYWLTVRQASEVDKNLVGSVSNNDSMLEQ